jgi:hypothetical protein
MRILTKSDLGAALAVGLVVAVGGCGGGTSPTAPVTPSPTPTASASPSTPPPATGSVEAVCQAIGWGTPKAGCDRITEAVTMLPYVEAAIDKLVASEPRLFNLDIMIGDGYKVVDQPGYFEGMRKTLAGMGICAGQDIFGNLVVKQQNDLDETYAILNSKGFVRRGFGSYLKSCIPSSFPLSPADQYSYVRTAFFGYKCPSPDTPLPVPASGEIPVNCAGIVTATPKDANGVNTPPSIHGNEVVWRVRSGGERIAAYPVLDGNVFNYTVQAREIGTFSLCARVGPKEGCLNGRVIPNPVP